MNKKIQKYYNAYANAYDSNMEIKYTIPKIYTAKGDISKRWYVYYSFRNPKTGKMERQASLTMSINRRFKTVRGRMQQFKLLQKATLQALKDGFNPYDVIREERKFYHPTKDVILKTLHKKEDVLKKSSYLDYKHRINSFLRFLDEKGIQDVDIKQIDRTIINQYLDTVLKRSSARNRNNHKTVISSMFSDLCEKGYIENNFILHIRNLKTKSKRDKTISSTDLDRLMHHVEKEDFILYMYISFVSYFFLRPIEVCRLKVGDINLIDKTLSVEIKQKQHKTKIIPDIIYKELQEYIKGSSKTCYLFTPDGVDQTDTTLNNRRDYFSKRFKKIRDELELSKEYTVYSLRHTYITKVYKELRKEFNKEESLSKLRLITGHTSDAIHKYIHYIDAELPEDYSELLRRSLKTF